ncbi:hypothetical protein J8273_6860 [Carpediemonas membranifera]|uniref:Uncharacterized protein n=1 Tax=Carpediemonas membranifera TaxID=201153 RepID=A0A8J6B2Y3_9EUKA|nr:hypothetical protein J8273_6860 [Carpediemonas membranifera]|eukprot:KAG9391847.1 hypothetical protein J8273_6860 [Carpediemonas membranifera]
MSIRPSHEYHHKQRAKPILLSMHLSGGSGLQFHTLDEFHRYIIDCENRNNTTWVKTNGSRESSGGRMTYRYRCHVCAPNQKDQKGKTRVPAIGPVVHARFEHNGGVWLDEESLHVLNSHGHSPSTEPPASIAMRMVAKQYLRNNMTDGAGMYQVGAVLAALERELGLPHPPKPHHTVKVGNLLRSVRKTKLTIPSPLKHPNMLVVGGVQLGEAPPLGVDVTGTAFPLPP